MEELVNVLVVAPTFRDRRELAMIHCHSKIKLFFSNEIDVNDTKNNIIVWVEATIKKFSNCNIKCVVATSDLGVFIASIISQRYGLDGTSPEDMYAILNKYTSRQSQQKIIPQCVPEFFEINTLNYVPPMSFPFFMKPVRAVQSMLASKIDSYPDYLSAIERAHKNMPKIIFNYAPLLHRYLALDEMSLNRMIAESVIDGFQVTVEGYVQFGKVNIMGVIDSEFYPGTGSFKAFHYPSILPVDVQTRMACVAEEYISSLNLNDQFFNMEMVFNENQDAIKVIEINPRMSSQFSDLIEKVDGINSYTMLMQLACGEEISYQLGSGVFNCASSFVLRCFSDHRVTKLPKKSEIKLLTEQYPEIRVELYGVEGEKLSQQLQDIGSYKYAVIQLGGIDASDLNRKLRHALKYLSFQLEELKSEKVFNG